MNEKLLKEQMDLLTTCSDGVIMFSPPVNGIAMVGKQDGKIAWMLTEEGYYSMTGEIKTEGEVENHG